MFDFLKKTLSAGYEKLKESLGFETDQLDLSLIEETLLQQNFTPIFVKQLIEKIQQQKNSGISWQEICRAQLEELFKKAKPVVKDPEVIIILGINGSGKTTSALKLARQESKLHKTLLVPADTFRVAAQEQLEELAREYKIDFFKHNLSSPASVIFESALFARTNGYQKIIIDTAGRIHQDTALLKELEKSIKTAEKQFHGKKIATYIVLDGLQGKSLFNQVKEFEAVTRIDGIIITKLDGQVKPGTLCSISDTFHIPIVYCSAGQKETDLFPFDPTAFINTLI